jgi:hypothetical protein
MPAGFAFNGSGGGVPTGFWTAPKTVSAPLYVPASPGDGVLGATVLYFNADSDTGDGSQLASEALTVVYRYDASGVPRFVALNPGAPFVGVLSDSHPGALGAWSLGPASPPASGADVRGLPIEGTLTPPAGGPFFHGGATFSVNQVAFGIKVTGPARARESQSAGGFVCSNPTGGKAPVPKRGKTTNRANGRWNANGTFTPKKGPASGHTLQNTGKTATDQYGNKTIAVYYDPQTGKYWVADTSGNTYPTQRPEGYTPPTATYGGYGTMLPSGDSSPTPATEETAVKVTVTRPDGSTYTQTGGTAPPPPRAGDRTAWIAAAAAGDQSGTFCPAPAPDPDPNDDFNSYVDPSGTVTARHGVPVAGAVVTLARSTRRAGALTRVPNGSAIMSPANRRNPDRTTALGMFGWDVLPGYYRVTVRAGGCTGGRASGRTSVLTVPPPALNLSIALRCTVKRAAARVVLRARRVPVREVVLIAQVTAARRGGRAAPQGVVTFYNARRRLGTTLVAPRSGLARLTVRAPAGLRRLRAVYAGDGRFGPARS